jgi:GntR family transcriptional regulator
MPIERAPSQYRQLADLLREAILRGDYAPGSTFPSEPELAEQYGVSRPTINRALLILRGEGLLRVERGRGTFVRSVATIPRYANTRYSREEREREGARGAFDTEITKLGLQPRSDLVQVGAIDPPDDIKQALQLRGRAQTLIRKRHMYAGDTPVQLATSYAPWTIAKGTQLEQTDTGSGGTYSRLAELGHTVTRITETVRVRPPSAEEASFLNLSDEQHVLAIFHTAWTTDDQRVEITIHVLPPHQWELHYEWETEPRR